MPITIRKAESAAERQRVFRFRYEIYVEEMQRPQTYADHDTCTIEEPFDATGHIFFAEDETGRVVGTVRTNFGRDTDFGYYRELYGMSCLGRHTPEQASISTKFMIAPHLRKGTLAVRLASYGVEFNLKHGILFDFIDCNPHLEATFRRLGYVRYRGRVQHPEYGDVLPLVLPLTDLEHLESVGSPWARICRAHCPQRAANRLLREAVHIYQTKQQPQAA